MDPAPRGLGVPAGRRSHPGLVASTQRRRPPPRRPILLNARAALRPTITGVERWTLEVLARLRASDPGRYVVAAPRPRARGRAAAQLWEQTVLPARAARTGAELIFSPANLAPLAWPRNVLVMHDAAVVREPGAYSPAYRAWHRWAGLSCARRALAIVTVSEFSRRELVDLAGVDPARVVVIPGGVSDHFAAHGPPTVAERLGLRRPFVLTIATSDARKNLAALTPVARALAQRGIDLAWGGDSRPYFSAQTAPPGLRALGYVSDEDLAGLYREALAFVLPSRYEGFGLTCLEAMASGTPVVAAARGALPETCGDAALLVDPDDRAALTEAVLRATTDPAVAAKLREAGLRRAAGYTWQSTAARVDALLRELAGVV